MIVSCQECGVERSVTPARAKTFKFCSYSCRGAWRAKHWTGEAHPRWQGGEREKTCLHCSKVCAPCHWAIHSGPKANGVNSGEVSAGNAGDNPEPSFRGNLVEGVTTRGRACRRWNGNCTSCGATLSRRMSDVAGKAAVFCDLTCRGKWTSALKKGQPRHQRYGGNASTSALRESGDIVWTYEETVRC